MPKGGREGGQKARDEPPAVGGVEQRRNLRRLLFLAAATGGRMRPRAEALSLPLDPSRWLEEEPRGDRYMTERVEASNRRVGRYHSAVGGGAGEQERRTRRSLSGGAPAGSRRRCLWVGFLRGLHSADGNFLLHSARRWGDRRSGVPQGLTPRRVGGVWRGLGWV